MKRNASGTFNLKFHKNFKYPTYNGKVFFFFDTDPNMVLLSEEDLNQTESNSIGLTLSKAIPVGRHEIHPGNTFIKTLPDFFEKYEDENGEVIVREKYPAKNNAGYIDVKKVDIATGVLVADINFTIQSQFTGETYQAVGKIDVQGWTVP
ncbi:hypothetical protein N8H71_15885 [Pseudomonas koreensis]|uniref:hypothetical protein n=1 Tax=Pseudomonas koreensis TaxID=198620 RepID=UPI0021CA1C3F|nr:hypothetical protein [Pseudomonas koreensis]MCU0073073.1 hypothetical protein [Pseudomonas koreensis]